MQSQAPDIRHGKDANEQEDQIKVTFYTDPLCCWSWAFEQHWRKFIREHGDEVSYELIVGGMIPSWTKYNDPLNSISTPAQMGPLWMYASQITRSPMHHQIWVEDPPGSSFPASIAVKTAGLQSAYAAERYLFDIRKAMMERGINIAREDALLKIARDMEADDFDIDTFVKDWRAGNGKEPFRADLRKTRFHGIGRFPTLTFQGKSGKGIMLIGYRPYDVLKEAFDYMRQLNKF